MTFQNPIDDYSIITQQETRSFLDISMTAVNGRLRGVQLFEEIYLGQSSYCDDRFRQAVFCKIGLTPKQETRWGEVLDCIDPSISSKYKTFEYCLNETIGNKK